MTVAILPLRKNSKRIPGKNKKKLWEKKLYHYQLDALILCGDIDKVVVATDDTEILEEIQKIYITDRLVPYLRSAASAKDDIQTEEVMKEVLLDSTGIVRKGVWSEDDIVILAQATNPFVTTQDYYNAIAMVKNRPVNLLSVADTSNRFMWWREDEYPEANYSPYDRPMNGTGKVYQEMLIENGGFYVTTYGEFIEQDCRLGCYDNIEFYVMPWYTMVELDNPDDWKIVEFFLSNIVNPPMNSTTKEFSSAKMENIQPVDIAEIKNIKLVVVDCDGVLTDNRYIYAEDGKISVAFNTTDGRAFGMLRRAGYETAIITANKLKSLEHRSKDLKVGFFVNEAKDKALELQKICYQLKIKPHEAIYIGNDESDIPAMSIVKYSFVPADAEERAKKAATIILHRKGGEGVLREVVENYLLK